MISAPSNFNHITHMGPGDGIQIQRLMDLPTTLETADQVGFSSFHVHKTDSNKQVGHTSSPSPMAGSQPVQRVKSMFGQSTGKLPPPRLPAHPPPPQRSISHSEVSQVSKSHTLAQSLPSDALREAVKKNCQTLDIVQTSKTSPSIKGDLDSKSLDIMRLAWSPHPLGKFGHLGNKSLVFKNAFILLRLKTVCLYGQVELLVYTSTLHFRPWCDNVTMNQEFLQFVPFLSCF